MRLRALWLQSMVALWVWLKTLLQRIRGWFYKPRLEQVVSVTNPDNKATIPIYLDTTPNVPKTDQSKEELRRRLHQEFERRVTEAVERSWDLPAVILKDPQAEYLQLLLEARDLYIDGRFYACVAMCGTVGVHRWPQVP